jgi:hypothetical protein
MTLKIPTSSIARSSQIYTNLNFWFENIPYRLESLEMQILVYFVLVWYILGPFGLF